MMSELEKLLGVFQRHLYLPDVGPVLVTLGTVAANRLEGDPVWLLLVGAPGNLKTEILQPTTSLPDVHSVGNLTEAGLLSGTATKERAKDATGGLLREIGPSGIICCKDFTSILSGPREKRAQVLAALREIYDGSWTRVLGTDGGKRLHWQGKVGFLGGVTPIIDTHHSVMSTMGERFVLYRMPELDEMQLARAALGHAKIGRVMRNELVEAVTSFFSGLDLKGCDTRALEEQEELLSALASMVARARSAVIRNSYTREVELVQPAETPGRIVIVLDRLRAGLEAIGVEHRQVVLLLTKVGVDCMPVIRGRVLQYMALAPDESVQLADIAEMANHPESTTRRHMEDLQLHGLLDRVSHGRGNSDEWKLSQLAKTNLGVIAEFTKTPEGSDE